VNASGRPATSEPSLRSKLLLFFAFSFASGLFFFGCLKLMTFHWISISVLVSILLVGMPIGGFIAVRFLRADLLSLSSGFSAQVVAMIATLAIFPIFVDPTWRLEQFLTESLDESGWLFLIDKFSQLGLIFLPYFVTFGMNEFLGYRIALQALGDRSELAYGIFLGGTSLAYVVLEFGSLALGVVPLMLCGAGAIGALAAGIRFRGRRRGQVVGAITAGLLLLAIWPGSEDRYLGMLEQEGWLSLKSMSKQRGSRQLHRGWSRYCHFSVLQTQPGVIMGYYNGGFHWFHRLTQPRAQLAADTFQLVPFSMLPENGKVLIIGSGGGEQVRNALMFAPSRVVAVEVIPEVLEVLGGPLGVKVNHIYEDPRVEPVGMDGRRYLDGTDERFDLIFLPVVDTSLTMMRSLFNPAETLYTVESFDAMRRHLSDDGVLVIQRPAFFDPSGVLLRQYVRSLADLGMHPYTWFNSPVDITAAEHVRPDPREFTDNSVYLIFARRHAAAGVLPRATETHLRKLGFQPLEDSREFDYLPKTDDFLFRSDMLFLLLGGPINASLVWILLATAVAIAVIVELLRRMYQGDPKPGPIPFWPLLGLGILVGLNFLLLEQFFIYKFFRILDRPMDAMFLGTVGFMLVTGASGVVFTMARRRLAALLLLALLAGAVLAARLVPAETLPGVLVALPLAMVTGALFPTLFRGSERALLVVFAADALGTLVGGIAAFLWPIAWGFQSYDRVALAAFALTAIAVVVARSRWRLLDE
jgi:SAM-dependent methyltransferase